MEPITTFLTTTVAGNLVMGILGDTSAGKIQDYWERLNLGNHDLHQALIDAIDHTFGALEIALTPQGVLRGFMTSLVEGNLIQNRGDQELAGDFANRMLEPFLARKKFDAKQRAVFLKLGRSVCRTLQQKKEDILSWDEFRREMSDGSPSSSETMNAASRETFRCIQGILFSRQNLAEAPDLKALASSTETALFRRLQAICERELAAEFKKHNIPAALFFELLHEQHLFMNGMVFHLELIIKNNPKVSTILQEYRVQEQLQEKEKRAREREDERRTLQEKLGKIEQAMTLMQQAGADAEPLRMQMTAIEERLQGLETMNRTLESWKTFQQDLGTSMNRFGNQFRDILDKLEELTRLVRANDAKLDAVLQTTGETRELARENLEETRSVHRDMTRIGDDVRFLKDLIQSLKQDVSLGDLQRQNLVAGLDADASFDLRTLYDLTESPENELGRGAVGVVYRAVHRGTGRPCALKILKPEFRKDPVIVARFLREGMMLKGLDHPNVVRVEEVGGGGGKLDFFIQMELLAGKTLRQRLDEKSLPRDFKSLQPLCNQLCEAVERIHQNGIIHRDINPNNLMILDDGRVKLMDFGVARLVGLGGLTQQGQVLGTSRYMSPEQKRGDALDFTSDIYCLGLVLYELLTYRLADFPPPAVRQFNPDVPDWMDPLLRACLEPEKHRRLETVAQIRRIIEGEGADPRNLEKYEDMFFVFLEDGKISKLEEAKLVKMREELRLPQGLVEKLERRARRKAIQAREDELAAAVKAGDHETSRELCGILLHLDPRHEPAASIAASLNGNSSAAGSRPGAGRPLPSGELPAGGPTPPVAANGGNLVSQSLTNAVFGSPVGLVAGPQVGMIAGPRLSLEGLTWKRWDALKQLPGLSGYPGKALWLKPGESVLVVKPDGTLNVWNIDTGECQKNIEFKRPAIGFAVSRDGESVAIAFPGGNLEIFKSSSWAVSQTIPCRNLAGNALAVTGDGRFVVSGHSDKMVRIWDGGTGEEIHALAGLENPPAGVLCSSDQRVVAAWSGKTLRTWNFMNGRELRVFPDHRQTVSAAAFSESGTVFAVGLADGSVIVRETASGNEVGKASVGTYVSCLAFSRSGESLLVGVGNRIAVLDIAAGSEIHSLIGHSGMVSTLLLAPDGRRLVSCGQSQSWDSSLRIWGEAANEELEQIRHTLETARRDLAERLAQPPKTVVSTTLDDLLKAHEAQGAAPRPPLEWESFRCIAERGPVATPVMCGLMTSDEREVVCGGADGLIRVIDLKTGGETRRLETKCQVLSLALTSDGRYLLSGQGDFSIRRFDLAGEGEEHKFHGHVGAVTALVPFGDRHLISGGNDGMIRFWDLETGSELRRIRAHPEGVKALALCPDGRKLVSSGQQKGLRVWDPVAGTELFTLDGHPQGPIAAISPDGKILATNGMDGSTRLWDLQTGRELRKGYVGAGMALAFTPDSATLLISLLDRSLRLIRLGDFAVVRTVRCFSAETRYLYVARSGRQIVAVGSSRGTDTPVHVLAAASEIPEAPRVSERITQLMEKASEMLSESLPGAATGPMSGLNQKPGDWSAWKQLRTLEGGSANLLGVAGDTRGNLVGLSHQGFELWESPESKTPRLVPCGRLGPVSCIAPLAREGRFLCGHANGAIAEWDLTAGTTIQNPGIHFEQPLLLSELLPDELWLSVGMEGRWKLWDPGAGREIRSKGISDGQFWSGFLSPDRRMLCTSDSGGAIRLWDVCSGAEIRRWQGPQQILRIFDGSGDGKRLLIGSGGSFLMTFDVETGKELTRVNPGVGILCGAYFRDTRFAVLSCQDKTLRIWDLDENREIARRDLPATVAYLRWATDSATLIACAHFQANRFPLSLWGFA